MAEVIDSNDSNSSSTSRAPSLPQIPEADKDVQQPYMAQDQAETAKVETAQTETE